MCFMHTYMKLHFVITDTAIWEHTSSGAGYAPGDEARISGKGISLHKLHNSVYHNCTLYLTLMHERGCTYKFYLVGTTYPVCRCTCAAVVVPELAELLAIGQFWEKVMRGAHEVN